MGEAREVKKTFMLTILWQDPIWETIIAFLCTIHNVSFDKYVNIKSMMDTHSRITSKIIFKFLKWAYLPQIWSKPSGVMF